MSLLKGVILSLICLLLGSCGYFDNSAPEEVVARVNKKVLYKKDVEKVLKEKEFLLDSATIITDYINDWATNQLLLDGALLNLSEEEQNKFEKLVQDYRSDLYTKLYKDRLINQRLDSTVSDQEAKQFYEANKHNFKLNEELIQLRYIQVGPDFKDSKELQKLFIDFQPEDRVQLDSIRLQFKNYFLNDSIWVKRSVVQAGINPINASNADKLLKKTNFLQLRDSLGLYLIAVKATLSRNETAPLEYVRPTIDQIIRNKRKLTLVKQLEKEIKDDAIKNKKFEIYN